MNHNGKYFVLYGREDMAGPFKVHSHHETYGEAVLKGQNRYGYSMFLIGHVNPNHDFTREEQLLKPSVKELLKNL